jgi:hypothetical protein
VPDVIEAIINRRDFSAFFRQINDPAFQVTGGSLKKIKDRYYLLGGQKFMGRYNSMGPTHGPGFVQQYTDAVRIFTLQDNGTTIHIEHKNTWTDAAQFHRRDYNAEAQILPNGEQGITLFSGVFQTTAQAAGEHLYPVRLAGKQKAGTYVVQVQTPYEKAAQKVIFSP